MATAKRIEGPIYDNFKGQGRYFLSFEGYWGAVDRDDGSKVKIDVYIWYGSHQRFEFWCPVKESCIHESVLNSMILDRCAYHKTFVEILADQGLFVWRPEAEKRDKDMVIREMVEELTQVVRLT